LIEEGDPVEEGNGEYKEGGPLAVQKKKTGFGSRGKEATEKPGIFLYLGRKGNNCRRFLQGRIG